MKRIAIAVVVGSTLAALAGTATAFQEAVDEAGIRVPAQSTYADSHPVKNTVGTAFPSSADEFGIVRLRSVSTYADEHKGSTVNSGQVVIPQGLDEGIFLPPMPASLESDASQAN